MTICWPAVTGFSVELTDCNVGMESTTNSGQEAARAFENVGDNNMTKAAAKALINTNSSLDYPLDNAVILSLMPKFLVVLKLEERPYPVRNRISSAIDVLIKLTRSAVFVLREGDSHFY